MVSTAPGKTLKTFTCRLAKSARSDCVSDHAAAFEALSSVRQVREVESSAV
jgi:hypothetical protein